MTAYLGNTARTLLDRGFNVWLVRDLPRFEFDPPRRLYFYERMGLDVSTVGQPYAEYLERVATIDRLFEELEASGARVIDLPAVLCDGDFCPVLRGDTALYRNANHLTVPGSLYTAPAFKPLFESMP